jgi:hypothetical protein
LRHGRKGQNRPFGVCVADARGKIACSVVASRAQEAKSPFSRLRHRRKGQNRLFGVCVTDARGEIAFLVVASATQVGGHSAGPHKKRETAPTAPFPFLFHRSFTVS